MKIISGDDFKKNAEVIVQNLEKRGGGLNHGEIYYHERLNTLFIATEIIIGYKQSPEVYQFLSQINSEIGGDGVLFLLGPQLNMLRYAMPRIDCNDGVILEQLEKIIDRFSNNCATIREKAKEYGFLNVVYHAPEENLTS